MKKILLIFVFLSSYVTLLGQVKNTADQSKKHLSLKVGINLGSIFLRTAEIKADIAISKPLNIYLYSGYTHQYPALHPIKNASNNSISGFYIEPGFGLNTPRFNILKMKSDVNMGFFFYYSNSNYHFHAEIFTQYGFYQEEHTNNYNLYGFGFMGNLRTNFTPRISMDIGFRLNNSLVASGVFSSYNVLIPGCGEISSDGTPISIWPEMSLMYRLGRSAK